MSERERRRNFVKWLMKRAIRHTFHLYTFTQCQFFMVFLLFMTHPKIFFNNYFPFSISHSRSTKFFHWIQKVLFVMFSACLSMTKILPFLSSWSTWGGFTADCVNSKSQNTSQQWGILHGCKLLLWWERDRKYKTPWNRRCG